MGALNLNLRFKRDTSGTTSVNQKLVILGGPRAGPELGTLVFKISVLCQKFVNLTREQNKAFKYLKSVFASKFCHYYVT